MGQTVPARVLVALVAALSSGCQAFDDPGQGDPDIARGPRTFPQPMPMPTPTEVPPLAVPTPDSPLPQPDPLPQRDPSPEPLPPIVDVRPYAAPADPLDRPDDWPQAQGFAGAASSNWSEYRCMSDARGNWVCSLAAYARLNPGPCAFTPDGHVVAAIQTLWTDTEASALVTRFGADGAPAWTRVWNRSGGSATHTLAALGLAVHADGRISWAGRDCLTDSEAPAAHNPDYYQGSCINAYVATLDGDGELLWELSFGTRDGADMATDLVLAPDGGVYVGGMFQAPLVLPGLEPLGEIGGLDHFVFALDADGSPRWAHAFGSAEHEADGVRLFATSAGELLVRGNFTQAPLLAGGFAARLDHDGGTHFDADVPYTLGHAAVVDGELLIAADDALFVLAESGELSSRALPGASRIAQLAATEQGTIVLYTPGLSLIEATPQGEVLRARSFDDWGEPWYHGGLCTGPGGAVALVGTARLATDFGFLEQPADDGKDALFVLHLADWEGQPAPR